MVVAAVGMWWWWIWCKWECYRAYICVCWYAALADSTRMVFGVYQSLIGQANNFFPARQLSELNAMCIKFLLVIGAVHKTL